MTENAPLSVTTSELLERYEGFLLDAYGVLVDATGALPGAARFIDRLEREQRPWLVVTNDASRSPTACAARYRHLGVPVPDDRVLTSGSLLRPHIESSGLLNGELLVLGPPDSHRYVFEAGAHPVGPDQIDPDRTRGIVIGDESGIDFLAAMEAALTLAYARRDRDLDLALILPNPDLVYPKRPGHFGFAAGTLAAMLEGALELRYPNASGNHFIRLGKPQPALFLAGKNRLGTSSAVMIGDQPATDIAGARAAGLDAALVVSGVGRSPEGTASPNYVLTSLDDDL